MKKMKKQGKGFTLTELAIVIAVIAILIAVLVPTFVSLINKANNSSDEQTVTNLNTALSIDETENGKPESLCAVWDILEEAGYNPAPTPNYSDNEFYWYKEANCIVIYSKSEAKISFPAEYVDITIADASSSNQGTALCATAVSAESTLSLTDDFVNLSTSEDDKAAHMNEFATNGHCSDCGYTSYSYMVEAEIISVNDGSTLTAVSNEIENLVIPDSITKIESNTLLSNTTITSVVIPDSVTTIGQSAFKDCTSLESVTLSDNLTSVSVWAFYGCTSLTNISIPDGVTTISHHAFSGCSSLTSVTLPDTLTEIGQGAFKNCTSLESITIPSGVTTLHTASYNEQTRSYDIMDSEVFSGCTSLKNVNIPSGVTIIGNDMFNGCTSLESLTLPDSVTSICESAFSGCTALTSINIPNNVTTIGASAFSGCSALTSISIPDSVTTISEKAFMDCTSLANITLGTGITSIDCTKTETASNQYTYTQMCFYNTAYYNDSSNWNSGVLYIGTYLICANDDASVSYTVKEGTTLIADAAFYSKTNITSLTLSDSITIIGKYAFNACTFSSIVVGKNLTLIGYGAFSTSLKRGALYYKGTSDEWTAITKEDGNTILSKTNIYTIYYYSETQPEDDGNYWHYNESNEVTVWSTGSED